MPPANVQLKSLSFQHAATLGPSALPLRDDRFYALATPVWTQAIGVASAPAVLYAADAVVTQAPVVLAEFAAANTFSGAVKAYATGGGVLGPIAPTSIAFTAGVAATTALSISAHNMSRIGRHDVKWNWYYVEPSSGSPVSMGQSRHAVYVVLSAPKAPWTVSAPAPTNPWRNALDWLFDHAGVSGNTSKELAFARIVVALRGTQLSYWRSELQHSVWYQYDLTADKLDLQGWISDTSSPQQVICYDTAALAAAFGTLLGCDATLTEHTIFGYIHPLYLIGHSALINNPIPVPGTTTPGDLVGLDDKKRSYFGVHAYASLASRVYDPCLRSERGWMGVLMAWWCSRMAILGGSPGSVGVVATWKLAALRWQGFEVDSVYSQWKGRINDTSTPAEAAEAGGSEWALTLLLKA
jgi:hypothetical protein